MIDNKQHYRLKRNAATHYRRKDKAMKQILTDYLDIWQNYRKDYLTKSEREQRRVLLTEWAERQYSDSNLTIPELYEFWNKNKEIGYNKIFIEKVIVPAVNDDIEKGEIEGLKFLFYCDQVQNTLPNMHRPGDEPINVFCGMCGCSRSELVDMIYKREPDNEDILKLKYYFDRLFLSYSIHEIPLGILKDFVNDASLSDIPEMLGMVDIFQAISYKLEQIDKDKTLIDDCRKYYTAYAKYLQKQNQYDDFEDYMNKNNIS